MARSFRRTTAVLGLVGLLSILPLVPRATAQDAADPKQRARAVRSALVAELGEGFRPALEVWTHVQSRPEPDHAYLTAGKRDVSFDLDLPRPVAWFRPGSTGAPQPLDSGYRVVKLNDQHAYLRLPTESPLEVGDLVALGISHPCTTFDRWQLLDLVEDDYTIVDAIRTFF